MAWWSRCCWKLLLSPVMRRPNQVVSDLGVDLLTTIHTLLHLSSYTVLFRLGQSLSMFHLQAQFEKKERIGRLSVPCKLSTATH
jgi:hypothetical protein